MTTIEILFFIAIFVLVLLYIRFRINIINKSGERFFLIKIFHDINQYPRLIKNETNRDSKRRYLFEFILTILLLLAFVGLFIVYLLSETVN
jgi:hypothetical protein